MAAGSGGTMRRVGRSSPAGSGRRTLLLSGIVGALAGAIVATISAVGYAGVALLMAVESACIPLPSEVIMPFAGYLAFDRAVQPSAGRDRGGPGLQSRLEPSLRARPP